MMSRKTELKQINTTLNTENPGVKHAKQRHKMIEVADKFEAKLYKQ